MGDDAGSDVTAVNKIERDGDGTSSSVASTPERDAEHYPQEQQPAQKRKGGRKPIYATSEERKQRNRQAQAAFRERRTEYIKQLETTIKLHEENLQSLQQSHRSAADECLMLRYKNSLLERILLEKGIDVQAELQAKTGSPTLGPTRVPPPPATAPISRPIQRYALNRLSQSRLPAVAPTSKPEVMHGLPRVQTGTIHPNQSPRSQPTPTSMSSPSTMSTKSPNFIPQGGANSPSFVPVAQQQQQLRPQQHIRLQQFNATAPVSQRPSLATSYGGSSGVSSASSSNAGTGSSMAGSTSSGLPNYYPSQFQNHYDQLGKLSQQEYDAQADMLDEDPSDHSAGPGPFPAPFQQQIPPQGIQTPLSTQPPLQPPPPKHYQQASAAPAAESNGAVFGAMNQLYDPYDPMLDSDPFGLSASMHFPTQFSYEQR